MTIDKISLCITNYGRFELLFESFARVLADPRISQVVVVDDSSDFDLTKRIKYNLDHPKIELWRNTENLGVYRNKQRAISLARNKWCILLDSDNEIGRDYIDTLYELPEWDTSVSYLPDFAMPHFDYRHFAGLILSQHNIAGAVPMKQFDCLINTMNGFYNKKEYMRLWDPTVEPISADSIYMNYLFLAAGNKLEIVKGLQYKHLVHEGSHYKQNSHKSDIFHKDIMQKLKQMR